MTLLAVTKLLDAAILAHLNSAVAEILNRVQELSAAGADVRQLLESLLPLGRAVRYGDVRGTAADALWPVVFALFERAVVGLPTAVISLDDDAAERMLAAMAEAQQALDLLDRTELREEWEAWLRKLLAGGAHGLLRGWACRTLLEKQQIDSYELYRLTRLAISTAADPPAAAAWVNGLLRGSGLLLLHQDGLWQVLDQWLAELTPEAFVQLLPLLRRAFAGFSGPERRQMGEKVASADWRETGGESALHVEATSQVDHGRARLVLPILAQLLGVPLPEPSAPTNVAETAW